MSNLTRAGRSTAFRLLLAGFLAFIPVASAPAQNAQELFDQGMAHFYNGDHEAAITSFRRVVAMAPDEAVAYQMLNQSQDDLLQLMVEGGEFEAFAREILASAKEAGEAAVRDEEAAAALAEDCFADDFETRSQAIFELRMRFGPFGAPPLIEELGAQSEDRRLKAIYALSRLGSPAVYPVLAATWAEGEQVRAGAVLVLAELNEPRAAARLLDLAAHDESGMVRKLAADVTGDQPAAEMLYQQGWDFLDADDEYGMMGADNYGVHWVADGNGVRGVDMPPSLVPCELAKEHFLRAYELGLGDAAIGLATTYATQISILDAALSEGADDWAAARHMQAASALTLGNAVLVDAFVNAVAESRVGAAQALADLVDGDHASSVPALQSAVQNASTADVRYAAAIKLAMLNQANAGVVDTLVEATTLDALRVVVLVDPDASRRNRLASGLSSQGIAVVQGEDGADALVNAYRSTLVDAFVIADPLPDLYATRVVKEIRANERFADTPILILGNEDTGDLDSADVVQDASVSDITDAFGDLGVERERYLATAAAAAEALARLAHQGADLGGAGSSLTSALGREDAVAIPAAAVVGHSGNAGDADALMGLIADDGRSVEARTAAALGLTALAHRVSVNVDQSVLEGLVMDADPALAQAAARALAASGGAHLAASLESE